jgi:hypothetical protein
LLDDEEVTKVKKVFEDPKTGGIVGANEMKAIILLDTYFSIYKYKTYAFDS